MNNIKDENFELKILDEDNVKKMLWIGELRVSEPAKFLKPYFEKIITNFSSNSLIVDFCKLDFLNSEGVTSIVRFIRDLEGKKIKTTMHYSSSSTWQPSAFKIMGTLIKDFKYIDLVEI